MKVGFGTTQVIVVLFIVVVLLGAIVVSYWADRAERKAKQRRLHQERTEQSEKPEETRRSA